MPNRILDNREEAEKARQDDHRADPGTGIEAKYATGFSRQAGKHTAHTGPLTRGSGRLKVFPGLTAEEDEKLQEDLWKLRQTAGRVLRGRNATIYERIVIDRDNAEEVARQFGTSVKRVHKILDQVKKKLTRAMRGDPPPPRPETIRGRCVREYIAGREHLPDEPGGRYIEYWEED